MGLRKKMNKRPTEPFYIRNTKVSPPFHPHSESVLRLTMSFSRVSCNIVTAWHSETVRTCTTPVSVHLSEVGLMGKRSRLLFGPNKLLYCSQFPQWVHLTSWIKKPVKVHCCLFLCKKESVLHFFFHESVNSNDDLHQATWVCSLSLLLVDVWPWACYLNK